MICVSLVSHGHGLTVLNLAKQLLNCPSISRLIITLNIPEAFPNILDGRVQLIKNANPKGFGANHNSAFKYCEEAYFCVINPDIRMVNDPFLEMLDVFGEGINIGLVAPLVLNSVGRVEDSMRVLLTPWSLLKRISGFDSGTYAVTLGGENFSPDWVAGMFMLFRSSAFSNLGGFDERYFMYCEDADICARLKSAKYRILACLSIFVLHDAQRASHRSYLHLIWHLKSLGRFFLTKSLCIFRNPH